MSEVRSSVRRYVRTKNSLDAEQYFFDSMVRYGLQHVNEKRIGHTKIGVWQQLWQMYDDASAEDKEEVAEQVRKVEKWFEEDKVIYGVVLDNMNRFYERYGLFDLHPELRHRVAEVYLWSCLNYYAEWSQYGSKRGTNWTAPYKGTAYNRRQVNREP